MSNDSALSDSSVDDYMVSGNYSYGDPMELMEILTGCHLIIHEISRLNLP